MRHKYYAGVGSRKTPDNVCKLMTAIAIYLADRGYYLFSGGAEKADKAFEAGAPKHKRQIFDGDMPLTFKSVELAKKYHPAFNDLDIYSRKLIARDGYQVLGPDLKTKVEFVVCWTKDGKASGGTGQAIRIAEGHDIRVYNLYNAVDSDYWRHKIGYKDDSRSLFTI